MIGDEAERSTLVGGVPIQLGVTVTEELNPFSDWTDTGIDTFCPNFVATDGIELIEKSGVVADDVVVCAVVCAATVTIMKVDDPSSPIGLPVAVTVYELAETFATL